MTSVAPAGDGGGGGGGTSTSTAPTQEQAPVGQAQQQSSSQHPPPSPLSGCYLLVVLPEPHTAQHKDLILNRLAKGFLSWDKDSCHVDLEKELQALVTQSPEGEEARNGERLIQYATENLVTEVLIYPQSNTLLQCIRNLLASFTKHRHIIHAGYTFGGNGSWILQDGTFSLADFLDAFSEHEVQRVLRAYENSVTVDIHCAGVGDWTTSRLSKEACTRACRVRVNPDDVLTAGAPAITSLVGYIGQYLIPQTLDQLMEPSEVVGNIRFSHPTLYVFPGGQGDAALFGINGFNMLVDGGFARKACFWDFVRHLDRLDAVLVTRINNSNVGGMSSVIRKKKEMHVYPQIGHFFCNLVERKHSNSPDGDKDLDPLIFNLIDVGQEMMLNLRHINLRPHPCYRDPEPINLYHKVGHGTLDMYVLSPSKDSREVREFMSKWNASDSKLFAGSHKKDSNSFLFPVQNLVSICALLVWQPANPEDTITRILFPGSTPQHKIFEGFERLKHLEFLKRPVCTAKSLSPSTSLATLKEAKAAIMKPKLASIERETKRLAEMRREKRDLSENKAVKKDSGIDDAPPPAKIIAPKPSPPAQQKTESKAKKVVENKKIESESKESKLIENGLKDVKKETKKMEKSEETKKTDVAKVETEKTAPVKELKTQKVESKKKETKEITKPAAKPTRPDSTNKVPAKPLEKKFKSTGEKKDIMKPSPTTPKKSINVAAVKTEVTKTATRNVKAAPKAPSAVPAKSAKDANNRKVVEQKNNELSSKSVNDSKAKSKTSTTTATATTERKPVTRRPKPLSPSKSRNLISPSKSAKSTPSSVKSEKDAVIRKIMGGTTDSSAVSTPSAVDVEPAHKLIDRNLTEKSEDMSLDSIESKVLADLKEEREVVEEIEAVLQKAERIEGTRKKFGQDEDLETAEKKEDDATEEDVTAEMDDIPKKISRKESQELTEEDEYLIVEKEEIFTEDSVQSGDAEQKHHLDEVESEKTRIHVESHPEESEQEEEKYVEEKKDEIPEKTVVEPSTEKKLVDLSPENKVILEEEMKQIIASATEAIQRTEDKDDSAKKDSEDITKEPSSISPEKLDAPGKPDGDQKELVQEKLEESQERISTLESGATTTAPTLPDDERVPLDGIKEEHEKHVLEEVKEKELEKEKEIQPEIPPIAHKPEIKVLDVKPPLQGIVRDIVKTPDEVADLPVHEEVDPKLYRMDDMEKDKDLKISPHETKEFPTPSPKEKEKGVLGFFGRVADTFEKGYDKLTKKGRRDSQKDVEDKSSKSSSPKESKPEDGVPFGDFDASKVFPKVGKQEEALDAVEKAKKELGDAISGIEATTALLQEDLQELKDEHFNLTELTHPIDRSVEILEQEIQKEAAREIKEVEAFAEEASQKFKNVKDSLQDSMESLEDKFDGTKKQVLKGNEKVNDMLSGVAEKLDDIIDVKEAEKVKFHVPESEDFEADDEDSGGVVRDFKEAVRDVAEVLVGTAGIQIEKEEKPKDVEEIVKKVAEVLKEDAFLPASLSNVDEIAAFSQPAMEETKSDVKQQVEDFLRKESVDLQSQPRKMSEDHGAIEEPFTKTIKGKEFASSPVKDHLSDLEEAKMLCADLLKDDIIKTPIVELQADTRADVMDLGLEEVCVKEIAEQEIYEEKDMDEDKMIVESEISFQQNLSPGKAELVTVTPGSTPTSPKFATETEFADLPPELQSLISREANLEDIIEEFIVKKKYKITVNIIEYIVIVKRVPKEKVINLIQEIIIKHKLPRESVADRIEILRLNDCIPAEKRTQIEDDIANEYLNKNKRINLYLVDEIAKKNKITKRIVIEIIEEIIVRRKCPRESVFDISDESYFTIMTDDLATVPEKELEQQDFLIDVSSAIDPVDISTDSIHMPPSAKELEDNIVDGFVSISSKDAAEAFLQHEKDLQGDGFEAVEQEYKVKDASATLPKSTLDDQKTKEIEEISTSISDVMEVDEKFVRETAEKNTKKDDDSKDDGEPKITNKDEHPSHEVDISEMSEADAKEKYLDEAKEKTSDHKEFEKLIEPVDMTQAIKSSTTEEKDSQESGSVKRMVVTASSEDGGHETEICPSGTITFTKAPSVDHTIPASLDMAHSTDSLRSGEVSPAESVFSKSPTDKTSPHAFKSAPLEETSPLDAHEQVFHGKQEEVVSDVHGQSFVHDIISDHKSPSVEIESHAKQESLEKTTDVVHHAQHEAEVKDTPKSPSAERELPEKETSVEKLHSAEHDAETIDRSKSPSAEKELHHKEMSPEKSAHTDDDQQDDKIGEKSRSPSEKKEMHDIEKSPTKTADTSIVHPEIIDSEARSKSPSAEKELHAKEATPEKSADDVHLENKSGDRSKSPSAEKELHDKEATPEKSTDDAHLQDKAGDKSKSPSVEKELHDKESTPEKSTDDAHLQDKAGDKSKSQSVERETHELEKSPTKTVDESHVKVQESDTKERSKSPSVEKELHAKETSPEKSTDDVHLEDKVRDKSKSPSLEKETHDLEKSPVKTVDDSHVKVQEGEIADRSRSPSAPREPHDKESTPEKSTDDVHLEHTVEDKSKSPSIERETHELEKSPTKTVDDSHVKVQESESKERSKSPSAEKELHAKEASPEKSTDDVHPVDKVGDKSKSPSIDRETHDKSKSPVAEDETHEVEKLPTKSLDTAIAHPETIDSETRSKSPSAEKEVHPKEESPEKSVDKSDAHHEIIEQDKSKSPSVEKEMQEKEKLPVTDIADKTLVQPEKIDSEDRAKSPSAQRDLSDKLISAGDLHLGTEVHEKSKSPSVEKETHEIKGRSKSPSEEWELHAKEATPEKSSDGVDVKHETPVKQGSKSPSVEKELHETKESPAKDVLEIHEKSHEDEIKERSKSPSAERELHAKEATPEKSTVDVNAKHETAVKEGSKSPSVEKELHETKESPAKEVLETHEKSHGDELKEKSKSPSAERELHTKEASPAKSVDTFELKHEDAVKERSKSPSVEKELHEPKKSPAKAAPEGHVTTQEVEIDERSKSPNIEKQLHAIEASPKKSIDLGDVHLKHRSKSPSAEREPHAKKLSPERSVDVHIEPEPKDRSKSPSVGKESPIKETSPEKSDEAHRVKRETEDDHKSRSPSVEKDPHVVEDSSKKITDASHVEPHDVDTKDKSKSPSVEKDVHPLEKPADEIKETEAIIDRSKSPSVEKESTTKQDTIDFLLFEKVQYSSVDTTEDKLKSKSPSAEREVLTEKFPSSKSPSLEPEPFKKESSPEKHATDRKQSITEDASLLKDKSRSPSVIMDSDNKETKPEEVMAPEKLEVQVPVSITGEKSKSPSAERDIDLYDDAPEKAATQDQIEVTTEVITTSHTEVRSKSPSVEKETSRRDSTASKKDTDDTKQSLSDMTFIHLEDTSRSSSIVADVTKDSEPSSKSRSESIQSVIDHGMSPLVSEKDKLKDEKSRTGSISESVTSETRPHGSKSPSPEKVDVVSEQFSDTFMEKARLSLVSDKFDEDSLDRTKSPSVLSDKSDEKDTIDRSKSPSVVGDKFDVGQTDDSVKEHLTERKPSLSEIHVDDKHDVKSKSVSPVGEKLINLDTSSDRKDSITSTGSHTDDKGRSRSHSLFDTGDKTPLARSRAASLYDEKLVERVSLLEHRKDSTGHDKNVFDEESEFRSSHETLPDIHKDVSSGDSKESDHLSAETRQAIATYILNEYIHKNKVITLACIEEITTIYKVDRYIVIKIVNELITDMKLKQEKITEIDEDDQDDANQKLLEVEENLMNYINEEFVLKKIKITSKSIDEIASFKSVPRPLVILVIENIILSRNLPRESVVDFDIYESQKLLKKDMGAEHSTTRKPSTEKIPERESTAADVHKSPSKSPEAGPSLAATTERPVSLMDEGIIISEDKREEIESLIINDYVDRGIKINETILENILKRTSVPKYIIIEIIQEIIVKKLLSKHMVVDEMIFESDDELDDTPKKLEHGQSSSSHEEHQLDKSMPYTEYESPFHKAFMGGMTEIRTTHITTLSGKSTPDFGQQEGIPESSPEVTSTVTRTFTSIPGEFEHESKGEKLDEDDEGHDRIVILKTTQITTYPEDEQEIVREFLQRQSLSGSSEMHKIEEEPAGQLESLLRTEIPPSIQTKIIEHDGDEHTEVVTTRIVKTIITETEMDPITKITRIISETPSETTTTTTHSKITAESTPDQEITIPATTSESQQTSTSKTMVTSTIVESGKSTPDIIHEEQTLKSSTIKDFMEHTVPEQIEQSISPLIRDLISDDRSYSGKSSPDVSLPKDIAYGDSPGKSTPELSMSPLIRDGTMIQSHFSGRSTPDKRPENKSRTATPEGFRSGEVIRTIITTTRTISDDGEFITTTQEVTETTNDKGETMVLATKTDVTVDEPAQEGLLLGDIKSSGAQRTSSPGSEKDKDPTSPRSDLSSGHSRAATHMWESSEERHTYSDEDPSSPLFSSSPHHPQDPRMSIKETATSKPTDFSSSAMSSSFYGQLPEEVAQFTSTITKITESHPEQDFTFRKLTVEKEFAGGYAEKDTKKYVDEADLDFEKALTAAAAASSSTQLSKPGDHKPGDDDDSKKDPLAGWGSPLKLPSPKAPRKFNLRSPIPPTSSADLSPDSLNFDAINDWGEPMRLPSPAPTANELSNKASPSTPKKERDQARKVLSENVKNKKRSESPSKQDKKYKNAKNKVQPIYVDLTYVSHHGNSFYTALEFFKKIRARYYVFSGTEPSREVYDALLEAKKTWEDKDLEVTLIPTYDTDTLGYWVADNEEALAANHIDLSPSASRCTINLQDHETSCSAYRLEF